MNRVFRSLALASGLWPLASIVPARAVAQERASDRDFRWDGPLASGRSVFVRNLNGSVKIERASGSRLEVTAVKRWRRGDPADATV
jgi:hypothetical protein